MSCRVVEVTKGLAGERDQALLGLAHCGAVEDNSFRCRCRYRRNRDMVGSREMNGGGLLQRTHVRREFWADRRRGLEIQVWWTINEAARVAGCDQD